ncbi:MAG: hypothetical protein AB7P76_06655 [Candidatus Melainabacteria bacterium]
MLRKTLSILALTAMMSAGVMMAPAAEAHDYRYQTGNSLDRLLDNVTGSQRDGRYYRSDYGRYNDDYARKVAYARDKNVPIEVRRAFLANEVRKGQYRNGWDYNRGCNDRHDRGRHLGHYKHGRW